MRKRSFLRQLLVVVGGVMFLKVYQCNKFIKKIYEKQRIERLNGESLKKIKELNIAIARHQHYQKITMWASSSLGMQPTKMIKFMSLVQGQGDRS